MRCVTRGFKIHRYLIEGRGRFNKDYSRYFLDLTLLFVGKGDSV